eukprot:Tbor_TRINITY_DN3684_c0_g1::TRINITY_DN3684_c0_g1_i1::g.340::m.340
MDSVSLIFHIRDIYNLNEGQIARADWEIEMTNSDGIEKLNVPSITPVIDTSAPAPVKDGSINTASSVISNITAYPTADRDTTHPGKPVAAAYINRSPNNLVVPVEEDTPVVPDIETLAHQVRTLEKILSQNPALYDEFYQEQCVEALKKTAMFHGCPEPILRFMAKRMKRVVFHAGSIMVSEDKPMTAYVIAEGRVERWTEIGGRKHLTTSYCYHSVGLLHLYNHVLSRFNAECKTDVVAYRMDKEILGEALAEFPELSICIIQVLSWIIRNQTHALETPLMQQKSHKMSYTATAVAASVEAFYRSALNNLINQKLTGKWGSFFPHMHIQVPARVLYISGLKNIRTALDNIDFGAESYAIYAQLMICTIPGVLMCPFSSLLEAAHATTNTESMTVRWTRGYAPRLVREVIFAVGINQMADYFAERVSPNVSESVMMRGAIGSVTAGVIAGYFSHIPHVLSTMKMYAPTATYASIWREIYLKNMSSVPTGVHPSLRPIWAQGSAILFPVGVVRRFCQIAGTFTIINGLTFALSSRNLY